MSVDPKTEMSMEAIGKRLAYTRIASGLSAREASMLLGLYLHSIHKYEQGRAPIRWTLLEELGRFISVDPHWIFYGRLLDEVMPVIIKAREWLPPGFGGLVSPAIRPRIGRINYSGDDLVRRAAHLKAKRGYVPAQVFSAHIGIPLFYVDWLPDEVRGAYIGGNRAAVFLRKGEESYYYHALYHIVARGDKEGVCFYERPEWERSVDKVGVMIAYGQGVRDDLRLVMEWYGVSGAEALANALGVSAQDLMGLWGSHGAEEV